jgi:outer membrane receptor protein involved in Fe transport
MCGRLSIGLVGLWLFAAVTAAHAAEADAIEEIIVTGELRTDRLDTLPSSVSVVTANEIAQRDAQHLEQLFAMTPNVNFASGASRARYLQIRGVGETGQFVEPLNSSVGLIIDHVDFSGIGTIGTLFDVNQVEVFRGPQGTLYGANALAGLVNVITNDPSDSLDAGVRAEGGDYDTYDVGAYVSGPLTETTQGRIALQQYRSDGYVHNDYLDRDDTNNFDELTARGKLRWQIDSATTIDLAAGYVDIDNGYDAFSLDNKRDTISDQPGLDKQKSRFGSIVATFEQPKDFLVETIVGYADSDISYGYDEDWTFVGFDPNGYSSTDEYVRDWKSTSAEVRFVSDESARIFGGSTDWVAGVYGLDQQMDLQRIYTFRVGGDFKSSYEIQRLALFGQTDTHLGDATTLTVGLRLERHDADYDDVDGVHFTPSENLWGGRIAVDRMLSADTLIYTSLSRGYKSGGFNTDGTLDPFLRQFDSETLYNFEVGAKGSWRDDQITGRVALFYMWRDNMQVATSIALLRPDGSTEFIDYTGNAASGTNYGAEVELHWVPTQRIDVFGSLGLLASEYDNFVNAAGEQLDGRQQAQAPSYQAFASVQYRFAGDWFVGAEAEVRDAYYFGDSSDAQSHPYELVNLTLGYSRERWGIKAWAKNLLDEDYSVKGFYFGNDPRIDYAERTYTQHGDPRRYGITLNWQLTANRATR